MPGFISQLFSNKSGQKQPVNTLQALAFLATEDWETLSKERYTCLAAHTEHVVDSGSDDEKKALYRTLTDAQLGSASDSTAHDCYRALRRYMKEQCNPLLNHADAEYYAALYPTSSLPAGLAAGA